MCGTYNYDYQKHSTFRFNFIDFQLYIDLKISLSNFAFFTVKSLHLASLKDRFLKKMLIKRAKTRRPFFTKL